MDEALRRALADPQVREFALRLHEFSPTERTIVLNLLNQARQLIRSMQARAIPAPVDTRLPAMVAGESA